jgi:hypothetical protein
MAVAIAWRAAASPRHVTYETTGAAAAALGVPQPWSHNDFKQNMHELSDRNLIRSKYFADSR